MTLQPSNRPGVSGSMSHETAVARSVQPQSRADCVFSVDHHDLTKLGTASIIEDQYQHTK